MQSAHPAIKNEARNFEKGYKKATKKLSQLFQNKKEEKNGFFTKVLRKMKSSPKCFTQSNKMPENINKTCTPANKFDKITQKHTFNDQHTTQQVNNEHTTQENLNKHTIQHPFQQVKHIIQEAQDIHQHSIQKDNVSLPIKMTKDLPKRVTKPDDHTEWITLLVNSHLFKSNDKNKPDDLSKMLEGSIQKPLLGKSPLSTRSNESNEPHVPNVLQPSCRQVKVNSSKYSVDEQLEEAGRHSLMASQSVERDEVRERLNLAAAKRNAIKQARLKEQMDLAWIETVEMMREAHKSHTNINGLLYQKLRMNAAAEPSSSKPIVNQQSDILIW
ncbi:unnamed protein product [Rhizopus stolonifer]